MHEGPDSAAVNAKASVGQFRHQSAQGKGRSDPLQHPGLAHTHDLARRMPASAGRCAAPVMRRRYDHFTTLDGATSSAAATLPDASPFSRRGIARSRKSIQIALPTAQPSSSGWS